MVEKSLHPEVVVHSKSFDLLGQGKVCEDHVMDLSRNKLVFIKKETKFVTIYLLSRRVVPSRPPGSRPSNSVQSTGRLESAAVDHGMFGQRSKRLDRKSVV